MLKTPRDLDMGFQWLDFEIRLNFDPILLLFFFVLALISFFSLFSLVSFPKISFRNLLRELGPQGLFCQRCAGKIMASQTSPGPAVSARVFHGKHGITVFPRETLASSGLPTKADGGLVDLYTAPKSQVYSCGVRMTPELCTRVRHGADPADTSRFTDESTTVSERFTVCDRPPRWADNVRTRRSRSSYDDNRMPPGCSPEHINRCLETPEKAGFIKADAEQ
jgi:hypothetical protein